MNTPPHLINYLHLQPGTVPPPEQGEKNRPMSDGQKQTGFRRGREKY